MPLSKARLSNRTDLPSSTSPHQPVETVQTPKPTSETPMLVSPRFRYLIYGSLISYLELFTTKSYYILAPLAVDMFATVAQDVIMCRVSGKRALIAGYAGGESGSRGAARAGSAVVVV